MIYLLDKLILPILNYCSEVWMVIQANYNFNQRTNGPENAHLIYCPSKAQNIQNLENIW